MWCLEFSLNPICGRRLARIAMPAEVRRHSPRNTASARDYAGLANVGRQMLAFGAGLLLLPLSLRALDPTRDLAQYHCQSWTRQTGLPVYGINTVLQSGDGYLWLGTAVGLLRFDGTDFKLFDLASVAGIRSSTVASMAEANDGGLWVGLDNGSFGYFDGTSFSLRGKDAWGGRGLNVRTVTQMKDGTLWLAAKSEAARITPQGTYEPVISSTEQQPIEILYHFADSHGRHWIASVGRGLHYWQDGKVTRMPDPALDAATCMAEDRDGNLWIGTSSGLYSLDSNLNRREIPRVNEEIRTMLIDRHGTLWIGTDGMGLIRYRYNDRSSLRKINGLASDFVAAITEDSEGDLWIGTRDGLSQLSDIKFATESVGEDPTVEFSTAVCQSAQGGAWVASRGSVTHINGKTRKTYSIAAGLPAASVKRVFEARNGDLYLVSGLTNLVILSEEKIAAVHPAASLVVGMVEDAQGVIVSVGGALYRADRDSLTPYVFTQGTPNFTWILNLAPGRDGAFWVASERGIFWVKDGAYRQWTVADGLPEALVMTVMEDVDGAVWASTLAAIVRLKDNHISVVGRKDGLFDNRAYAIVPDDLGNFWVDSQRGIFRVSRQSMNDLADGKIRRVECQSFDGSDSVKTVEKTTSQECVGCKSSDGRIWFPSAKGVVIIDPAHIPTNPLPPIVHVVRVLANGEEVSRAPLAVVRPGKGELEFHFTAISFPAPARVKYRYRLEGYDQDWVDAADRRLAFYTNLKPGRYAFQVIAANTDGVWNTKGDSVGIQLLPYFYQSTWFFALSGVALCAMLGGLYSRRIQHLDRQHRALQETRDHLEIEVRNRTAELARANASLKLEIDEHQRAKTELEQRTLLLEKQIQERNQMQREIDRVQRELLEAARLAGMGEVATGILHNVGNVLNSVNVSTGILTERVRALKVDGVSKMARLLREQGENLVHFLGDDARGHKVPAYLDLLAEHLELERMALGKELEGLTRNVEHIKEIVAMQQNYAKVSGAVEMLELSELVEDAFKMHSGAFARHGITVQRDYEKLPTISVERHGVLQVLVNLLHNAKHACEAANRQDKRVTMRLRTAGPGRVKVEVTDNGIGIPPENLTRIFSQGFTTRKGGHGFGLHSGALTAKQLGGSLSVQSKGVGGGATFILDLPCEAPQSEVKKL